MMFRCFLKNEHGKVTLGRVKEIMLGFVVDKGLSKL
jgi:hypothetical protein